MIGGDILRLARIFAPVLEHETAEQFEFHPLKAAFVVQPEGRTLLEFLRQRHLQLLGNLEGTCTVSALAVNKS